MQPGSGKLLTCRALTAPAPHACQAAHPTSPALLLRQQTRFCPSRTHLVQVDDAQVAAGEAGGGQRGHGVLVGDEVHKLMRHPACMPAQHHWSGQEMRHNMLHCFPEVVPAGQQSHTSGSQIQHSIQCGFPRRVTPTQALGARRQCAAGLVHIFSLRHAQQV